MHDSPQLLFSRYIFWGDEQHWPREPEGLIFLARAMLTAAPFILEADPFGDEFKVEWVKELPPTSDRASEADVRFALRLLQRSGIKLPSVDPASKASELPRLQLLGDLGSLGSSLSTLGQNFPQPPPIPQEQWDYVRGLVADRQRDIYESMQRRAKVTEWFTREIFDRGNIATFVIPLIGGPVIPGASWIWNTKWPRFDHVLRNCAANWDAPLDPDARPTHHIFLNREQFDAALNGHQAGLNVARSERLALLDNPEAASASAPSVPASEQENQDIDSATASDWWRGGVLQAVIDKAADLLRADPTTTRDALFNHLSIDWPDISMNFMRNRVWSKARVAANLTEAGTPGKRKANSAA